MNAQTRPGEAVAEDPDVGRQLGELLQLIEGLIDLEHLRAVDARYLRALRWHETDRVPLLARCPFGQRWQLPSPWDRFTTYPYRRAYHEPAMMMQNQLLDRVVPGLLLEDDNPLAIRADHGTIQVATALGGSWDALGDDYPWVQPFDSERQVHELISGTRAIDLQTGVTALSTRTMQFYRTKLAQYPRASQAIQISLPDLQGPLDTAEQLWGSDVLLGLLENPSQVGALLDRIVEGMLELAAHFRRHACDRLDPQANSQHGYIIPGRLMIRADTAILVSPDTYREVVAPTDAELLRRIGTGAIHFCGNGQHLIEPMLEIPALRGLDFGQSRMMDLGPIYEECRRQRVAITNLQPERAELTSGEARRAYPTGVALVYPTTSIEDAREVVLSHRGRP